MWDITIGETLRSIYEKDVFGKRPPECLYGSKKMWAYLNHQGKLVARCTIERLMRDRGYKGVTGQKKVRTTMVDPMAKRAPDLVMRNFRPSKPNKLFVSDFTYVLLLSGFGYTAFVIDAYTDFIVGFSCSSTKDVSLVEKAINESSSLRANQNIKLNGSTTCHSDAGSQYTSIHYSETLFLQGLTPSIGTVGDAYDNALAESIIGLYKTECIRADSPFRNGSIKNISDLEEMTSRWVYWFNNERLLHRVRLITPVEAEANYFKSVCCSQNYDDNTVIHR